MSDTHSNRHKHLELITQAIERMARNSAMYKAWTITMLGVLSTIAVDKNKYELFYVGIFTIVSFYIADVYYLWLEQIFVKLYAEAALDKDEKLIDYKMDIRSLKKNHSPWKAILSGSQIFYLVLFIIVLIVLYNTIGIIPTSTKN